MNSSFERFLRLSKRDRADVFVIAARDLGTTQTYVEKDFWVCLVLELLYNGRPQARHPRLLFKGGTSLSKAFALINRFSEDIDIAVSREDLGFIGDGDPTNKSAGISGKNRAALFDKLRTACSGYICGDLRDVLEQALTVIDPTCIIRIDPDDKAGQTLLVEYQSLFDVADMIYVLPRVKIEGGAKSGLDPHSTRDIKPFISGVLPEWNFDINGIATLDPDRTFWEKLLILHGLHCGFRDEGRLPANRNLPSRHYYDVAMIVGTEIGRAALGNHSLAAAVREHNLLAFRTAWKKFEEAVPGSLRIVPQPNLQAAIEKDYAAMGGMVLGEAPSFVWIIERLAAAESIFNKS